MRTSTQRLKYRFPSHVGFCWTQGWHLTSRRTIADTAACAKRFRCRRPFWCRQCVRDKKVWERKAPRTLTGTANPGLLDTNRWSPEAFQRNSWWHRRKLSANCRTVESSQLRKCLARLLTARDTDCNPSSTSLVSCRHGREQALLSMTLADSVATLVGILVSMASDRVFLSTSQFELLPLPCQQLSIFGIDRTGNGFAAVCPRGKLCQRDRRTWLPFVRCVWRSLCSPRRCARHSVDTQQCRRIQRTIETDFAERSFASSPLRRSSMPFRHLHSQYSDYCYWCMMVNSKRSSTCFEELNIYYKFRRVSVAWDFHCLTLTRIVAMAAMLDGCSEWRSSQSPLEM